MLAMQSAHLISFLKESSAFLPASGPEFFPLRTNSHVDRKGLSEVDAP